MHRKLLLANIVLAALAGTSFADELRWKFTAGDVWLVTHDGTSDSTTIAAGKANKTIVHTTVTTKWTIGEVNADGAAKITIEITRLQLQVDSAAAGNVKFDSDVTTPPAAPADKDLAALMKPLVGGTLTCLMTPRGELQDVTPDAALAKALGIPADGAAPNAQQQGVLQLLKEPLVTFPLEVAKGESWLKERAVNLPFGAGSLKVTSTYEGVQDKDAAKLARINVVGELSVTKNSAAKIALKSHEQTGVIWFDNEAGRLTESETTQKISTVTPYRESNISVKSASRIRVTLKKQ